MEKVAKEVAPEITPAEEIKVATEGIVAEAKEEVKEAPSRIRKKLRQLAAVWEGANVRSSASTSEAVGSSLSGMYGAKWQALGKEHEKVARIRGNQRGQAPHSPPPKRRSTILAKP